MTMPNTTSISVPSPMAFADAREAQRAKLRSRIDQKVAKIAHAKAAASIEATKIQDPAERRAALAAIGVAEHDAPF